MSRRRFSLADYCKGLRQYKDVWRDILIGVSFCNLCYFRIWSELLTYRVSDQYLMARVPAAADYLAAVLNISFLGTGIGLAKTLARNAGRAWIRRTVTICSIVLLAVALNSLRAALAIADGHYLKGGLYTLVGRRGVVALGVFLAAAAVSVSCSRPRLVHRAGSTILVLLSPFVMVTFGQSAIRLARSHSQILADKPLAPRLGAARSPVRVVWLVFDELDQDLTFEHRHQEYPLPEFDRFRESSFCAVDAHSASSRTYSAMVSLINGRRVVDEKPRGPSDLMVTFEGSSGPVPWSVAPNVFSRARQAGFNSGLAGWYHPYCRVLGANLVTCDWAERATQANSMGIALPGILANQARSLFETPSFSIFGRSLVTVHHIQTYLRVLESARSMATDANLGLLLIHFPIPHAPKIYDPTAGRFAVSNAPVSRFSDEGVWSGYFGNLVLADRTLGSIRASMEAAGVWDRTAVLVSSDHPLRTPTTVEDGESQRRVPFLLKLPGQKQGITYEGRIETVISQELLLAVLGSEIRTMSEVGPWLERKAGENRP